MKERGQCSHLNIRGPSFLVKCSSVTLVCRFICVMRWFFCVKHLLHKWHLKGFSPLWILRCILSAPTVRKALWHTSQYTHLLLSWSRMCTFTQSCRLNLWWQTGHSNCFSIPCITRWPCRWTLRAKDLGQWGHWKGLRSECIAMCWTNVLPVIITLPHTSHATGTSKFWLPPPDNCKGILKLGFTVERIPPRLPRPRPEGFVGRRRSWGEKMMVPGGGSIPCKVWRSLSRPLKSCNKNNTGITFYNTVLISILNMPLFTLNF